MCKSLRDRARLAPATLSFQELCALAECAGYEYDKIDGQRHIYVRDVPPSVLPLVDDGGRAFARDVRTVLAAWEDSE